MRHSLNHDAELGLHWEARQARITLPEKVRLTDVDRLTAETKWLNWPVEVVDFSQVKVLDSACLAVLLHWSAALHEQTLQLIEPPQSLQNLIQLYDMESVFSV